MMMRYRRGWCSDHLRPPGPLQATLDPLQSGECNTAAASDVDARGRPLPFGLTALPAVPGRYETYSLVHNQLGFVTCGAWCFLKNGFAVQVSSNPRV